MDGCDNAGKITNFLDSKIAIKYRDKQIKRQKEWDSQIMVEIQLKRR